MKMQELCVCGCDEVSVVVQVGGGKLPSCVFQCIVEWTSLLSVDERTETLKHYLPSVIINSNQYQKTYADSSSKSQRYLRLFAQLFSNREHWISRFLCDKSSSLCMLPRSVPSTPGREQGRQHVIKPKLKQTYK